MDLYNWISLRKDYIAVVGLGYVGLPLAVAFAEHGYQFIVAGFGSTEDYEVVSTEQLVNRIRDEVYAKDKVRKGAIVVMHMSDSAQYTAHGHTLLIGL